MTDQTTAVTVPEDNRIGFGSTHLRPQDIVPPRVKIVQQMSKEVADKRADPGDYYNTLTGENYGPALVIQPISLFMQRILLVRREKRGDVEAQLKPLKIKLEDGEGLLCRSFDMIHGQGSPGVLCEEQCPLSKWQGREVPPLCTETYNVAAVNELGELLLLSFAKSSARVGKRIFSAVRLNPIAPWARQFSLTTVATRNDQGNFFVADFAIASERPDTAQIKQAEFWAKQLQGVVIDVSPEAATDEGSADDRADNVGAQPKEGDAF